ncbi:MAG: LptF/LptG family permease, partial [Verrucomicrobiae bacterium]|nr:LptF/LptG family permease [Verrucomicrobiae bacterium]
MRIRILDRYLLREFLWPLLWSFDAFLLLFIVHDLLENLGDFLKHRAGAGMILRYYLIVLPEPLVLILPLTVLLGVLFCLSMLGRHNELIAMRASGLSVERLALPFFVAGTLASGVSFALGDRFVPRSRERAVALQREMSGQPTTRKLQKFFFSNPQQRRDWYAAEFDPDQNAMRDVAFYQRSADGKPELDVFARRAVWLDDQWRFEDVRIVQPQAPDIFVAATNFPFLTETPKRLLMESKHHQEMTTTELRRFARSLRASGRASQQA